MAKRNRLRNGRHQAVFGADGAIMAAATLAAARINAAATANAAKQQAAAVQASAKSNADAIIKQNENNNNLQERSIEFTKEQNERNRDLQKEIQMNLQLLTGQQNTNEMKEAAKIQVKCGGSMRRKLRNAGIETAPYSLQGRNSNLPFTVTDGGAVIPIAKTPEGYDLYEIVGNDHEHYHKAQGGKSKTGVGIRFAGRKTIEGEGNQNTNQGELMLVTPTDAKFISKHSIKGFNPTKAVIAGVHPIDAFNKQEELKAIYGISDDGNYSPVRGMKAYGGLNTLPISPDLSLDFLAPVATGIVAGIRNENQAKCGRSLRSGGRRRAADGTWWDNYGGATINAGANILGAGSTILGNYIAGNYLTNAYNKAAGILGDAYDKMHGVDMSAINRDDYRAAHAMAALQAPIVNTGAERSAAERTLQRNLARINRGTLSSAAAQNRSARAEVDYNDKISQIEANANKIRQGIIQGNMERITQVSNENANRDTQANQQFANAYLTLLQYNNDIENEKISGKAQAYADSLTQTAGTRASLAQANAASLAGALTGSASGFNNTLSAMAKQKNEHEMTLSGGTDSSVLNYIYANPKNPTAIRYARAIYDRYNGSGIDERQKIANRLKEDFKF